MRGWGGFRVPPSFRIAGLRRTSRGSGGERESRIQDTGFRKGAKRCEEDGRWGMDGDSEVGRQRAE